MKWQATREGTSSVVVLKGRLDESAKTDLFDIRSELSGVVTLVIDVSGLTVINSLGIFHWLEFTRDVRDRATLTYTKCQSVFLSYVMMISSREADAVRSFYALYECAACGVEEERLLLRRDAAAALTTLVCMSCGAPALQPTAFLAEVVDLLAKAPAG